MPTWLQERHHAKANWSRLYKIWQMDLTGENWSIASFWTSLKLLQGFAPTIGEKCKPYRVKGNTLEWTRKLPSPHNSVILEGETWESSWVTSGVTQELVKGPLFFLIYINDLPEVFIPTTRLFANIASFIERCTMSTMLNHSQRTSIIHNLEQWKHTWLVACNPHKCEALPVTNKRNLIVTQYTINGTILANVKSANYLRVNIKPVMGKTQWNHNP